MNDPRIARPPSSTSDRSDTAGKSGSPVGPLSQAPILAGKFRLVKELGRGGMGAVYEVIHELTRHHRALKVVRRADNAEHLARLLREASAAGRVANPHVVDTYDAGTLEDGQGYILMELLEGATLFDHLRAKGDASIVYLIELIAQACEGLHAAHEAGIVHRDVKPPNLFVTTRDGAPFLKVVDFGVSKFDPILTEATELTSEGALLGTPAYMSPEQIRGHADVDRRADVYAIGVILYTATAGERPFKGKALADVAIAIASGEHVPLQVARRDLPLSFTTIVEKAMSVRREDRFQDCQELAKALREQLPEESIELTLPPADPKPAAQVIPLLPPPPIVVMPPAAPASPEPGVAETALLAKPIDATPEPGVDLPAVEAPRRRTWPLAFALGGAIAILAAIAGARATSRPAAAITASPEGTTVRATEAPKAEPKVEDKPAQPTQPAGAAVSPPTAVAPPTKASSSESGPGRNVGTPPKKAAASAVPLTRRNPYD